MKKQWLTIFFTAFLALQSPFAAAASEIDLSNSASGIIPEERLLPRLVDQADLLEDEAEAELLERLDEISERQECDVIIVTVHSMNGKSAVEYADDTYDYNGYGFGEDRDGILFLLGMEERDWAISTCGEGITMFTDAGQEYMVSQFKSLLSEEKYQEAFSKYAQLCDEFITQARTGEPFDKGNLPRGSVSPFWIFGDLAIGFLIALCMGNRKKAKLKSVRKKTEAQDYVVGGTLNLNANWDQMIDKRVSARTVSTSSSSQGGSSTHTSSSGTTHGGSSGKF